MASEFPDYDRFQDAVEEGDYHRALGIPADARRLRIDASAARLAQQMPEEAGKIMAIACLLTHEDDKRIYVTLRKLQAGVMRQLTNRCSKDVVDAFSKCRQFVWNKCCRLFQFELGGSNLPIGPRGASSLAAEGQQWIVDFMIAWDGGGCMDYHYSPLNQPGVPRPLPHLDEFYAAQSRGNDVTLSEMQSFIWRLRFAARPMVTAMFYVVLFCTPYVLGMAIGLFSEHSRRKNNPHVKNSPLAPVASVVPSFKAVQWRSAVIGVKMHAVEILASQDPDNAKSQAKAQITIAHCHIELAHLYELANFYSPLYGNEERPREHRQKAIEILEPFVADHPNLEWPQNMLARAQCSLDEEGLTSRQIEERAIEMLECLITENPGISLYPRMLKRAKSELNKDSHVPDNAEHVRSTKYAP